VRYGVVFGLILLAIDTAILPLIPNIFKIMPVYELIVIDFVALVRITVFTCMGMYCCSVLKINAFPAIRCFRDRAEEGNAISSKHFFILTVATVLLAVGYSVVLFKLTTPHISAFLKQLSETQSARLGAGSRPSLLTALVVLEFAFSEEIVFRLGIQNYLAKQFKLEGSRYWIAILLTTLFWSLAHANTLDPEWVKIAQVFPLGLALGYLFRKYGVEMCILVHGVFNLIMIFLTQYLITT